MKQHNLTTAVGKSLVRMGGMGLTLAMTVSAALAENSYAQSAATWVLDGAFWLIICVGIIGLGMAAVKRNATLAVGILIGAGISAFFCKNPEALATIGGNLAKIFGLG